MQYSICLHMYMSDKTICYKGRHWSMFSSKYNVTGQRLIYQALRRGFNF